MNPAVEKPKLLVLVGPTAVGKTAISIEIARRFGAEIISGDSMQVYRGMNIGTAKIRPEEMNGIPHHLIDIHSPDEPFSVAEFQQRCRALIPDIASRGKLPFIVGGTGLYVESVSYEFQFSENGADEAFRQEQTDYALQNGAQALHDRLAAVDPESATRLHPNDQRRIIRALEVYHMTGVKLSDQLSRQMKQSPYQLCIVGLTMDREMLYKRIEARIDQMLEEGLLEEVQHLLDQGYTPGMVAMQGLGYKEIAAHLSGGVPLQEAVVLLKRDTRRFAKRQLSWFRHMQDIHWVDVSDTNHSEQHIDKVYDIVAGNLYRDREYTSTT
ncbi:tRNA (adenosine(37)-N6)-dimethylallyltransferase MiaA [Paenibacillus shenyangensis]|uniref:tRNA (adenosine(37)-N6)-dimethylallyltransferase MiaA n=1 Tax=Paenibacillus sp. A9 TaxID=1284352 RepID=UPI00036BA727|nr:tRNA (adenosine(37)-N6)-dimethylallyltransferase MiaA [Paenibacillus sp. A9]